MKSRSDVTSSRSCSCTSCLYKSESDRPSLRRFIARGSRIDKLHAGKYLPRREEKLLNRLIRTRAVYDDIRTQLLSDYNDSDTANLKPTQHMPIRTQDDRRERKEYSDQETSSVLLELVSLIDRGAALPNKLSQCCSCCVCGGSITDRQTPRIHKHKHGHISSLSSMTSAFRSRDQHRSSKHGYRAKNIQSDPCTCTSIFSGATGQGVNAMVRNRPKPVFEQYEDRAMEGRRQKVKGYKTKHSGMGEIFKRSVTKLKPSKTKVGRAKRSRESIFIDTKNKVKEQVKRRTKRFDNDEIYYSLRHKKSEEEEELEVQEAIELIKRESLKKLKEEKRKLKEEKKRRKVKDEGPYEGDDVNTYGEEKEARGQGAIAKKDIIAKSDTAIQTKKERVDIKTETAKKKGENKETKELTELKPVPKPKSKPKVAMKNPIKNKNKADAKVQPKEPEKKDKPVTHQPTEPKKEENSVIKGAPEPGKKNFGSGGYALKRCFCTLKLKPRVHKTRRKQAPQFKNLQTDTYKTQSSATSVLHPVVNYATTPTNTRRSKYNSKSKNLLIATSTVLQYECDSGVCKPGECDPIECNERIKRRGVKYTTTPSNTKKLKQTSTSKLLSNVTSGLLPYECEPGVCAPEECIPIECNERIKRRGLNYSTTPSNTRKFKQNTKSTSKLLSNPPSGLLPYECEPGVCLPGECNPLECNERIKRRGANYATNTNKLQRRAQSISSVETKSSGGSQTPQADSSAKAIKIEEEEAVEKHVVGKEVAESKSNKDAPKTVSECICEIPVQSNVTHKTMTDSSETYHKGDKKVGNQIRAVDRPSQMDSSIKSKYSLTKHNLKRCFCTLKFTKKGKISVETHSKGTLTSDFSLSDMKERPTSHVRGTEKREKPYKNRYKLQKYECEPGICISGECDPYRCLEIINKRSMKLSNQGSRAYNRRTKSTYSIAKKRFSKSKTTQSASATQKQRNDSRGQITSGPNPIRPNEIVSSPNQISSSPNRQAVKTSSSFSFDIEFYKHKGDTNQMSRQNPVTMKIKKRDDKSLQGKITKSHHKSTSMQTITQDEGIVTVSKMKRCFCTLKLQKRARNPRTFSSTATETGKYIYPKIDNVMVTRSTKMKRKDIQRLGPYECEPNFCFPGECDPYTCLKRIQVRDRVKSRDFGSGTDKNNRSTGSITDSITSNSKNILVKSDSGRVLKKRKRSKYTTSSSNSKVHITPDLSSRQAVRIGSNFSFNVEFYKNRTFDMPQEPVIISSKKKIREVDRGDNAYKTNINSSKTQLGFKRANKGSWIQPILKRCFCTLKLQKKNNANRALIAKNVNPVVMAAQVYNDNLQNKDKGPFNYISTKRSISGKKSVLYKSNIFASSIKTVSNIWFNSNKSIVSSEFAYKIDKTLRHRHESRHVNSKDNIERSKIVTYNPFVKKSLYAMNVHGIQRRPHKLEPYECEPGVCVPGECDPYQCQKLIMKRLTRRSSTMTYGDNRSHNNRSTSSGKIHTKASQQQYGSRPRRRKEKYDKPKEASQVISYKLPSAQARKQAVRIGSSFSFDVEFFKNRRSPPPEQKYQNPVSRDSNERRRRSYSVGSATKLGGNYDRGIRGSPVSFENRPSQSGIMTQDKGSSIIPRSKRCFCTLQLKKRGKLQVQVGHEAKPRREPYTNATQNTKKYKMSALDPNECEPGVCVPGMCDPYECLERIKRRKYDGKNFGTDTKPQSAEKKCLCKINKRPQGKYIQINDKIITSPRQKWETKDKPVGTIADVTGPPALNRQAVKLSSSFSFNVEFYKNKAAQRAYTEPESKIVRTSRIPKSKRRKDFRHGTSTTNSMTRAIQDSTDLRHQDTQSLGPETSSRGTKTGSFLRRCFCTTKLFQKQNVTGDVRSCKQRFYYILKLLFVKHKVKKPPTPRAYAEASNQTVVYKEKTFKMPKLEPYECEPGVCVPGECDPFKCAEIIKRRNRSVKISSTDFGDTRSTSTTFRASKPSRSIGFSTRRERQRKEKRRKEMKLPAIKYQQPVVPNVPSTERSFGKNAVKIGSNFSFNVEFYKINYPTIQRGAKEVKMRRQNRSSSSQLLPRTQKQRGVGKRDKYRNNPSQAYFRKGEKGTGMLKRCFCTLALQADDPDQALMMSQGTDSPYYKTYPIVEDKNTHTRKLAPYECEPGVCIPGECNPYECIKLIQRRREYGTSTKRRGTSSTSTFMRDGRKLRDSNVQSRRAKRQKVRPSQQSLQVYQPQQKQDRQAVKLGSSFSFNVEFSKSKTGNEARMQEPKPVRIRQPRMEGHRKTSSTSSRPDVRMSTRSSTPQGRRVRDTDSQAARNVRSILTETRPFLKRCFCTLQIKNSNKSPRTRHASRRLRAQQGIGIFSNPKYESKPNDGVTVHYDRRKQRPIQMYTATVNTKPSDIFHNAADIKSKTKKPAKKQRLTHGQENKSVESNNGLEVNHLKNEPKTNRFQFFSPNVYSTFVNHNRTAEYRTKSASITSAVGPFLRCCPLKLQKHGRLQRTHQKLEPFECEPNICVPGQCDPHKCYERIQRRNLQNSATNTLNGKLKSPSSLAGNKRTNVATNVLNGKLKSPSSLAGNKRNQVKKKQILPKETYARKYKDVPRNQRRISNTTDNQDRRACRIGSNFSFNIEFYKNSSPSSHNIDNIDFRQSKRSNSKRQSAFTNTSKSNRSTTNDDNREKSLQARYRRRDRGLSMKSFLQRCFCTLALQKKRSNKISKQNKELKPYTEDKSVSANIKHKKFKALDPNECEPGICIPGQCDPYLCLERIKKRNLVTRSTKMRCNKKVSQQTLTAFGPSLKSKKVQFKGTIPSYGRKDTGPSVVETPRIPFIQPGYFNGIRFGSNIKCNIEFYKEYCIRPDGKDGRDMVKIPVSTKMPQDNNSQKYSPVSKTNKTKSAKKADGDMQTTIKTGKDSRDKSPVKIPVITKMPQDNNSQKYSSVSKTNKTKSAKKADGDMQTTIKTGKDSRDMVKIPVSTKMPQDNNSQKYSPVSKTNKTKSAKKADGAMQTTIKTEDKSSIAGKALKRCFCTAKLQNRGPRTNRNNVVYVGRADNIITNSPFQPNNLQIYQMRNANNNMETILPYAPDKFKSKKSKTVINRKGILKKCNCCKEDCKEINSFECTQSTTRLSAKREQCTLFDNNPVQRFLSRFIRGTPKCINVNDSVIPNPQASTQASKSKQGNIKIDNFPGVTPKKLNPGTTIQNNTNPKLSELCDQCIELLKSKSKKNKKKDKNLSKNIPVVEDEVNIPCKNCKKNRLLCECHKYYKKLKKGKEVRCRQCNKPLTENELNRSSARVKSSAEVNYTAKVEQGNGHVKSKSKSKTNAPNSKGKGDNTDTSKYACADTCSGNKKEKKKEIKEELENTCSPTCKGKKWRKSAICKCRKNICECPVEEEPLPESKPVMGFKLSKIGRCDIQSLNRKKPCICGSTVCAMKSLIEQLPKKEVKPPPECVCGSSVCNEEMARLKALQADSNGKKDIQNKEAKKDIQNKEAKKDIQNKEAKKDIQNKEAKKDIQNKEAKKDIQNKEAKKDIQNKEAKKDIQNKEEKKDIQNEEAKKDEEKSLYSLPRLSSRDAKKTTDLKKMDATKKAKMKKMQKEIMKKKEEAMKKAKIQKKIISKKQAQSKKHKMSEAKRKQQQQIKSAKLTAKHKRELKLMAKRRKSYNKEDKLRRQKRAKMDELMYKRVKKTKNLGDGALVTESLIDIAKLGCVTLGDILRSTFRTATDPRNTYHGMKVLYNDPELAIKSAKNAIAYSGLGSTYKRVRLRISMMERVQKLKKKLEEYHITHYLVHILDKHPPKFRKRRKMKTREPTDFECSPFMSSLRKRPFLSVYYNCPWFYPHCLSLLTVWKQFTDILLFLLAVVFWSPCIFAWEAIRALMCCTMCTA